MSRKVSALDTFKSIIQNNGEIDNNVISKIQTESAKWINASGVLCDRKISSRLKNNLYKTVVRITIIYGAECWLAKKKHTNKINVTIMRMLR